MQKHPLSYACAYTMLGALVVFGLAGVSTKYMDLLPAAWGPFILEWAPTATVVSLGLAFVAAAVASMRSAWHAERALQAGPAHRRIFWLALAYTGACIIIEVTIGKVGAYMIGKDVNTAALTALLTFFAIAPRLVSYILAGMDGIQREADEAAHAQENAHDLDRLRIIEDAREKAIREGNIRRIEEGRRAPNPAAMLGVGLALGAGSALPVDAHATAPVSEPAPTVSTLDATADGSDEWDTRIEAETPAAEPVEPVTKSKRVRRAPPSLPPHEAVRMADDFAARHGGFFSSHKLAEVSGPSQSTIARSLMAARERGMLDGKPWARKWLRTRGVR